jgi:tetratricopeptide (TPR) repeat protein
MSLRLHVQTDDQQRITATHRGERLAGPTPLDDLPTLPVLQADAYVKGRALLEALGGSALIERLEADDDRLLLLHLDADAAAVPWEYAALSDPRQFLGCRYGMLRLIDREAAPPTEGPLHVVALGADPLVDEKGNARDGYRLQLDAELRAVRRVLRRSNKALQAQRVPPTRGALRRALLRGPALLHLSCHGDVIPTADGPTAVLLLEDACGGPERLLGPDLVRMPPRGVLRSVLLSACRSAAAVDEAAPDDDAAGIPQADLARALVHNGVPAAIGMQGKFPDKLSGALAATLYEALLAGYPLSEALRQVRQVLSETPAYAGLPVAYAAREGWAALDLPQGRPQVPPLHLPGDVLLGQEIQPPRPLRGRNAELHALARRFDEHRVVTVVGAGGIGKTALAATYAERFGWRWPDGVRGLSFAAAEVDAAAFRQVLLERLLPGRAQALEHGPEDAQTRAILNTLRGWDGLLLVDNYESVLQALNVADDDPKTAAEANAVHRLLSQAAGGGAHLLLTSRRQPAGFPGEVVFPEQRALAGLETDAAAALFLHHSTRAKANDEAGVALARAVARATEGHPLALALLAGEYDVSDEASADDFLAHWDDELEAAQRHGLAGHHVTFTAALDRSYAALNADQQRRLRALSRFDFPFFAEGAAPLWAALAGEEAQDEDVEAARATLGAFTRRSLLQIDGWFNDDTPATWRFQPTVRQALVRRVEDDEREALAEGYAAYGAWLAKRGYGNIHKDIGLNRVVRVSLPALDAAAERLTGTERLWHVWRTAWLKNAYGLTGEALAMLEAALESLPPAARPPTPDHPPETDAAASAGRDLLAASSSLRYQLADVLVTRGDLDRALNLYHQSLEIKEHLGDQQGKAASLHQMAQIYVTRGDLDRALSLYQQSLDLYEHLGDLQGKAASLHQMANILMSRQQWDEAETVLKESRELARQVGVVEHLAFATVKLGQVAQARGETETALARYREGLAIFQRLGMPRETAQVQQMIARLENRRPRRSQRTPRSDAASDADDVAMDLDAVAQMSAEQVLAGTRAQLDDLPPEQRAAAEAQLQAFAAQWETMSPEERRAFLQEQQAAGQAAAQRQQIESLAQQASEAAVTVFRGDLSREVYVEKTSDLVKQITAQAPPDGSPWAELTQYLRALLALVQGEEPPPVPSAYAAAFAAVREETGDAA